LLQNKIASWWIPDQVVIVDAIPLTATGKVSKMVLRAQVSSVTQAKL
jgi:fatty-acyl-CoA synthase